MDNKTNNYEKTKWLNSEFNQNHHHHPEHGILLEDPSVQDLIQSKMLENWEVWQVGLVFYGHG